ncbi:MAG: hypothetical protein ACXWQZ_12670 [Ktedonobacterales bacterium]
MQARGVAVFAGDIAGIVGLCGRALPKAQEYWGFVSFAAWERACKYCRNSCRFFAGDIAGIVAGFLFAGFAAVLFCDGTPAPVWQ